MNVDITDPVRRAYLLGRFPRPKDYANAIDISTRTIRTAEHCEVEAERLKTRRAVAQLGELRASIRDLRVSMKATGYAVSK